MTYAQKKRGRAFDTFLALAVTALLLFNFEDAQAQTTVVTGTIYETAVVSGSVVTRLSNQYITLKEIQRAGSIIIRRDVSVKLTDGTFSMTVPRSNFTAGDTTKIRMYAPAAPLDSLGIEGVWMIVPDAATADLNSMSRTRAYGPPGFALLVPRLLAGTSGDLDAVDTLIFEGGATVVRALGTLTVTIAATMPYGDSIRVADSLARLARQIAETDSARIDTVGSAERAQIVLDIQSLAARLDTAGQAERSTIVADIITLTSRIADAGKWNVYTTGSYKVMAPKFQDSPLDTLTEKHTNDGSATFAGPITADLIYSTDWFETSSNATGMHFGGSSNYITRNKLRASGGGFEIEHRTEFAVRDGSGYQLKSNIGRTWLGNSLGIGVTDPANRLEVAGNLEVIDSTITAPYFNFKTSNGKIWTAGATSTSNYIGYWGLGNSHGNGYNMWSGGPLHFRSVNESGVKRMTVSGDSITMYKPTTINADVNIDAYSLTIDADGAGPSKASSIYFGRSGSRIYSGYYNGLFYYANSHRFDVTANDGYVDFLPNSGTSSIMDDNGKWGFGTIDVGKYSGNFGGNLYVNLDSLLFAGTVVFGIDQTKPADTASAILYGSACRVLQRGGMAGGYSAVAGTPYSIALGYKAKAGEAQGNNYYFQTAIGGDNVTTSGWRATAIGGANTTATGGQATAIGGAGCIASGSAAVAIGGSGTASGSNSLSLGAVTSGASGTYSVVMGGRYLDGNYKYGAFMSGSQGTAKWSQETHRGYGYLTFLRDNGYKSTGLKDTTNNTATDTLSFINTSTEQIWEGDNTTNGDWDERGLYLPAEEAYEFTLTVVAFSDVTNEGAKYKFEGMIKRTAAGVTSFVGTPSKAVWEDDATWDCEIVADDASDNLFILVTGDATDPVKWVATITGNYVEW